MAFLFLGGGLDSLNNSSGSVTEQTTGMDASFSRCQTNISGSTDYAETPAWTAVQELWLHFYLDENLYASEIVHWMDGTDVVLKLQIASGNYRLYYLSALATWTQLGSDVPVSSGAHYFDIYFKSGASGAAGFYYDGVEKWTSSGSYTYSTDVTSVRFQRGSHDLEVSQVAVREASTIGGRVMQGYMSGAGATTAWTGDYTSVDEATLNEADYIYSGTADQVETFAQTLVGATTGYVPVAVSVSARAKRGATGPQNVQLALRSGSTNYFSATKALGLGYTAVQNIWETNPDTGLAFTSSQLAALQPGVKSIT